MKKTNRKPQIHYSHISMFHRCPEQYRRRYIEGEIIPPGCNMVSGTGMHKAAETDLKRFMDTGALAPEEEVKDVARDSAVSVFDSPIGVLYTDEEKEAGKDKVRGAAIDMAVRCAEIHHNHLAPFAKPKHVERKWVVELEGFPCDLAGTIDCDEGVVIWDWKTSAKTPVKGDAANSQQITMYSMAKKVLDGVIPRSMIGYVVKSGEGKAVTQGTERTEEDFSVLMLGIEKMVEAIQAGIFVYSSMASPRQWHCDRRYCGYYDTCKGVSGRVSVLT